MADEAKDKSPWDTETGLADDFDGTIANPRFGIKEEYAQQVIESSAGGATGLMFIADLVDDNGEVVASQGWSVGGGWEPNEDGSIITHPKRANVVTASLYGQLQNCVIKELAVDMTQLGLPTEAMSWNGLKFHWMQKPHATVGGTPATGLMPTLFIGKVEAAEETEKSVMLAPKATPVAAKAILKRAAAIAKPVSSAEKTAVEQVAKYATIKEFQKAIVKFPEVVKDDALMAQILDDSETGFFATHKK